MLRRTAIDINKSFIVNYAPIFSYLRRREKNLIIAKSKVIYYKKGSLLYRQGDSSDAFYCVISGRVKLSRVIDGRHEIDAFLTCGMYCGITSLLTTKSHSQTAEAVNDSLVLKINKDDFDSLLTTIPALAIDLSKTLSQQVRHKALAQRVAKSMIVSIYSAIRGIGRTMYTINLALSLSNETKKKVIIVEVSHGEGAHNLLSEERRHEVFRLHSAFITKETLKQYLVHHKDLGIDMIAALHDEDCGRDTKNIVPFLTILTQEYDYVLVDLPVEKNPLVLQVLSQSDTIHIMTDYEDLHLEATAELMAHLFENVEYPQEKIKVILNEKKGSHKCTYDDIVGRINHDIYAAIPALEGAGDYLTKGSATVVIAQPQSEYARTLRRIARDVGDVLVGLALGSGAALGLAHVGVLKVLERENIPIDIVAGSSIGALIAAFWASGMSAAEIERVMMEYNHNKGKVFHLLGDFCFPKSSLAKGRQVALFVRRHLGTKTFQDVKLPLKILVCKLTTRQKVIIESGQLADAVVKSVAIPGLFAPHGSYDNLIVDGGILEPVPVDTLREAGVKKIIAVNVLPSPEEMQEGFKNYQYQASKMRAELQKHTLAVRLWFRLSRWLRKALLPNIFDMMVNSILGMEYVMAKENCKKADIVISPIIPGADWVEFYRAEELIKKGETEAHKSLARIKQLIEA